MNKLYKGLLVLAGLVAFPVFAAVDINTATQSELEVVKWVFWSIVTADSGRS
jgi:competence protein ComEA